MGKILIVVILLIALGIGGFVIYKNYFGTKTVTDQSKPTDTQTCDLQEQTCSTVTTTANSGSIKVKVLARENPISGLEVDLGDKPGATKYYLKITDGAGVALFEGIPAGSYVVYFNQENFPENLGSPSTRTVEIKKGETGSVVINIIQ